MEIEIIDDDYIYSGLIWLCIHSISEFIEKNFLSVFVMTLSIELTRIIIQ
jgi:hypothetical protein